MANIFSKRIPELPDEYKVENSDKVKDLDKNGFVMLPNLVEQKDLAEVFAYLNKKLVYDRWNKSAGYFSPENPPTDCHTANYCGGDIVKCPHLLSWANDPKILSVVGQYLGGKPTLSNLAAWWSYPGHDEPQQAENFHRDVDDLSFLKLFIYLTDVDDEAGPHVFIPRSHTCESFSKIRRYTDEEIKSFFGEDSLHYFTGPTGTAFLENTYGLHKGQLPKNKRRLLFQAQYSLGPIGIYEYAPLVLDENNGSVKLDRYINRLYIK